MPISPTINSVGWHLWSNPEILGAEHASPPLRRSCFIRRDEPSSGPGSSGGKPSETLVPLGLPNSEQGLLQLVAAIKNLLQTKALSHPGYSEGVALPLAVALRALGKPIEADQIVDEVETVVRAGRIDTYSFVLLCGNEFVKTSEVCRAIDERFKPIEDNARQGKWKRVWEQLRKLPNHSERAFAIARLTGIRPPVGRIKPPEGEK